MSFETKPRVKLVTSDKSSRPTPPSRPRVSNLREFVRRHLETAFYVELCRLRQVMQYKIYRKLMINSANTADVARDTCP